MRLYPLYHPAAALYTRSMLDTLRADVARLPALLAMDPPPQPEPVAEPEPAVPEPRARRGAGDAGVGAAGRCRAPQLGLF